MMSRFAPSLLLAALFLAGCDSPEKEAYDRRMDQASYERSMRESPAEPDMPHDKAAELCIAAGRELETKGFPVEAAEKYELALKHDPSLPGIHHRLGILYERQNEPMKALAAYNKAIDKAPNDPELLADMGYFYMSGNQWKLAEPKLRRAVMLNPNLKRGWNNLGITLAQQGRADEAFEAFTHAVPAAAAHSNTGIILARRGNYDAAREHLNLALKLDPNIAQARVTLAWINQRENPTPAPAPTKSGSRR